MKRLQWEAASLRPRITYNYLSSQVQGEGNSTRAESKKRRSGVRKLPIVGGGLSGQERGNMEYFFILQPSALKNIKGRKYRKHSPLPRRKDGRRVPSIKKQNRGSVGDASRREKRFTTCGGNSSSTQVKAGRFVSGKAELLTT